MTAFNYHLYPVSIHALLGRHTAGGCHGDRHLLGRQIPREAPNRCGVHRTGQARPARVHRQLQRRAPAPGAGADQRLRDPQGHRDRPALQPRDLPADPDRQPERRPGAQHPLLLRRVGQDPRDRPQPALHHADQPLRRAPAVQEPAAAHSRGPDPGLPAGRFRVDEPGGFGGHHPRGGRVGGPGDRPGQRPHAARARQKLHSRERCGRVRRARRAADHRRGQRGACGRQRHRAADRHPADRRRLDHRHRAGDHAPRRSCSPFRTRTIWAFTPST